MDHRSIFELEDVFEGSGLQVQTNGVNISEGTAPIVHVKLTSSGSIGLEKFGVTSYQQTLLVVFLDAGLKASTCSATVMLSWKKIIKYSEMLRKNYATTEAQEQASQWPIPAGTKWVLVVVRCDPFRDEKPVHRTKIKGMMVVKVVGVGN